MQSREHPVTLAGPPHSGTVELPISRPEKIICVGANYRDHADELSFDERKTPILFAKWPNTLIGPGEAIRLPIDSTQVDYEGELGVVIGRHARNVRVDEANDVIAGYVCLNDISARDMQFSDGQWTRGKSADTFCPIGPRFIPAKEISNPQNLTIRTILNGEVMQDSSTLYMLFTVAEIIAFVTRTITLLPGDLIATGTPGGVGAFRNPPLFLKSGDLIAVEIEGIGVLENPVIADVEEPER